MKKVIYYYIYVGLHCASQKPCIKIKQTKSAIFKTRIVTLFTRSALIPNNRIVMGSLFHSGAMVSQFDFYYDFFDILLTRGKIAKFHGSKVTPLQISLQFSDLGLAGLTAGF